MNKEGGVRVPSVGECAGHQKGGEEQVGNMLFGSLGVEEPGDFPPLPRKIRENAPTTALPKATFVEALAPRGTRRRELLVKRVPFGADGKLTIPNSLAAEGVKRWNNSLVGIIIGRHIPFGVVARQCKTLWGKRGLLEVGTAGGGMILLKFESETHLEAILERSDWHVMGCPIVLRRWSVGMTPSEVEPTKLPLWMVLSEIPMELWHWEGMEYLANSLGTPLRIDERSFRQSNVSTARIQIEMSADQPLRRHIDAVREDGSEFQIKIKYEFFPPQCNGCGVVGHGPDRCPKKEVEPTQGRENHGTGRRRMEPRRAREVVNDNGFQALANLAVDEPGIGVETAGTVVIAARGRGETQETEGSTSVVPETQDIQLERQGDRIEAQGSEQGRDEAGLEEKQGEGKGSETCTDFAVGESTLGEIDRQIDQLKEGEKTTNEDALRPCCVLTKSSDIPTPPRELRQEEEDDLNAVEEARVFKRKSKRTKKGGGPSRTKG